MTTRRAIRILSRLLLVLLAATFPTGGAFAQEERSIPFEPGEKLHFVLKWEAIPVGHATLSVEEMTRVDGQPVYHFGMSGRTNKVADMFFKVRDTADSYASLDLNRSLKYVQNQREGGHRRHFTVRFDKEKKKAFYESHRSDRKRELDVWPHTLDPLSIFYHFRTLGPLHEGMTMVGLVSDGKKAVVGLATVIRRETVTVEAGTFEAYLIEPDLKDIGGVFEKSPEAKLQIWVTADEERIPILIRSKVVVGYFQGELSGYENVTPSGKLADK